MFRLHVAAQRVYQGRRAAQQVAGRQRVDIEYVEMIELFEVYPPCLAYRPVVVQHLNLELLPSLSVPVRIADQRVHAETTRILLDQHLPILAAAARDAEEGPDAWAPLKDEPCCCLMREELVVAVARPVGEREQEWRRWWSVCGASTAELLQLRQHPVHVGALPRSPRPPELAGVAVPVYIAEASYTKLPGRCSSARKCSSPVLLLEPEAVLCLQADRGGNQCARICTLPHPPANYNLINTIIFISTTTYRACCTV